MQRGKLIRGAVIVAVTPTPPTPTCLYPTIQRNEKHTHALHCLFSLCFLCLIYPILLSLSLSFFGFEKCGFITNVKSKRQYLFFKKVQTSVQKFDLVLLIVLQEQFLGLLSLDFAFSLMPIKKRLNPLHK